MFINIIIKAYALHTISDSSTELLFEIIVFLQNKQDNLSFYDPTSTFLVLVGRVPPTFRRGRGRGGVQDEPKYGSLTMGNILFVW